jgi:hypothetical protein
VALHPRCGLTLALLAAVRYLRLMRAAQPARS